MQIAYEVYFGGNVLLMYKTIFHPKAKPQQQQISVLLATKRELNWEI